MLALAIIATVLLVIRWIVSIFVPRFSPKTAWEIIGGWIGTTVAHGFVITVIWLLYIF